MGANPEKGSELQAVVEQYMSAVEHDRRHVAEQLLATLHAGFPRYGGRERAVPGKFDWFGYFRDLGYALSETTVNEHSGHWAVVEAKCSVSRDPHLRSEQTVVFRLFLEGGSWLISDISLNLDADVSRGDRH